MGNALFTIYNVGNKLNGEKLPRNFAINVLKKNGVARATIAIATGTSWT